MTTVTTDTETACPTCPPGTHSKYGSPSRTFDVVTIGEGGWSGWHSCNSGYSSHYGHTFMDRVDAHTIIQDKTSCDWDDLLHGAVSGPMLDTTLPEGAISRARDLLGTGNVLEVIAERYFGDLGALDKVALDVYLQYWLELGAYTTTGDDFVCVPRHGEGPCRDCEPVTA